MKPRAFYLLIFFLILSPFAAAQTKQPTQPIAWQPWSDAAFQQARKENKFVLLDLQAVWCHWCHVMDETTYTDPQVRKLIGEKYIALKVDQDSRPDISNRYEDYGWPATVVFGPDGKEIVKRRGYLPPQQMASMLQAIIDDPTPGPSIQPAIEVHPASTAALTDQLRLKLQQRLIDLYDNQAGGWGRGFKFVDADVIEYCMIQSRHGDPLAEKMVRQTLTANLQLVDPAWGGVYQYSTDADWIHPHFEKIMSFQAEDLRNYARAALLWNNPQYIQAALAIHHFLTNFLQSPQGVFYVSQDADLVPGEHGGEYFKLTDSQRRQRGIPRIDQHIYSRENGWAINSLATLYACTGDAKSLSQATTAANWILKNRALQAGGFRHDENDAAGPYLGDTVSMGRALLSLYAVTGERQWLTHADAAANFIESHFPPSDRGAGFPTALPGGPQIDENIAVARFERLLFFYTGKKNHQQAAESAMRYLAAPEIASSRNWLVGGILLADRELSSDPIHITIVGSKNDQTAKELFTAAMRVPFSYLRLEWFDPAESPLPNADVEYPQLPQPAAFLCTGDACSSPMYHPQELQNKLKGL